MQEAFAISAAFHAQAHQCIVMDSEEPCASCIINGSADECQEEENSEEEAAIAEMDADDDDDQYTSLPPHLRPHIGPLN